MADITTTVEALLERVELTRRRAGAASVAKAYLVLVDNADDHEFRVAVPRDFAIQVGKYLESWDEADQSPRITVTFTITDEDS